MYIPDDFAENRLDVLHSLITEHPFGVLFTHGSNGLDANHLPFELQVNEGKFGMLHAHVSRNNSVWQDIKNGDEVLVVFQAAMLIFHQTGIHLNMNSTDKYPHGTIGLCMLMAK